MIEFDEKAAKEWLDNYIIYSKIQSNFVELLLLGPTGKGIPEGDSIGRHWTDEEADRLFENCCISFSADCSAMRDFMSMEENVRQATLAKALRTIGKKLSDFQKML